VATIVAAEAVVVAAIVGVVEALAKHPIQDISLQQSPCAKHRWSQKQSLARQFCVCVRMQQPWFGRFKSIHFPLPMAYTVELSHSNTITIVASIEIKIITAFSSVALAKVM
jgi:hypothetical protein